MPASPARSGPAGCAARAESCLRCRQRQPLGFVRIDEQRDDVHRHRLVLLGVALDLRARGEHLHVGQNHLRCHVLVLGGADGRNDVDARARHDVAGDADDLVDAHRHRAHAGGMTGGRPAPASFDASFIGRIGSFWMTGRTSPRPTTSFGSLMTSAGTALAGHSMTANVLAAARRRCPGRLRRRPPAGRDGVRGGPAACLRRSYRCRTPARRRR